jgi:hypothetical protein
MMNITFRLQLQHRSNAWKIPKCRSTALRLLDYSHTRNLKKHIDIPSMNEENDTSDRGKDCLEVQPVIGGRKGIFKYRWSQQICSTHPQNIEIASWFHPFLIGKTMIFISLRTKLEESSIELKDGYCTISSKNTSYAFYIFSFSTLHRMERHFLKEQSL